MFKDHFTTFAAYNQWANEIIFRAAGKLGSNDYHADKKAHFGSVHRTLNHILVADRIWLHRMTLSGPTYPILDVLLADTLMELQIMRKAEDQRIINFINQCDEESLGIEFEYTTTEGDTYKQRYCDVLPHFFNHQTHHRGQASTLLTQFGLDAPEMDLAYFLRERMEKQAA